VSAQRQRSVLVVGAVRGRTDLVKAEAHSSAFSGPFELQDSSNVQHDNSHWLLSVRP